jgi:hypothetical protein
MYFINQEAQFYTQVNATIWLSKDSEYFFFYCDLLLEQSDVDALGFNKLCTLKSMQNGYPKTDNVNLVIRGLGCESPESL